MIDKLHYGEKTMIIIITGASHTGKTLTAQKSLKNISIPIYLLTF